MAINYRTLSVFTSFVIFIGCLPVGNTVLPRILRPTASLAGEPGKVTWKQHWDSIVAEAKKEGNLGIYTTANGGNVRKVGTAFTEKYGIKVEVLAARGPELMQKMEVQRRAGINAVDVVIAGGTNLMFEMKPLGYLDRLDEILILPEVTDPKAWITGTTPYMDKGHNGVSMISSVNRGFIKNSNLVKEGEISSYKDLLKPRWKGKIIMSDPTIPGAGNSFVGVLAYVWGVENTKGFLRQLIKQDLVITRDMRQQVEWVAREKYDLGVGTHGEMVMEFVKIGAPISPVLATEGSVATQMSYGLGLVNKRPNPNAAVVFANWILSREGNAVLVQSAGLPGARVDSPREGIPSISFPQRGEKFFTADEEEWKREKEMLKVTADIFNPIIK